MGGSPSRSAAAEEDEVSYLAVRFFFPLFSFFFSFFFFFFIFSFFHFFHFKLKLKLKLKLRLRALLFACVHELVVSITEWQMKTEK